MKDHDNGDNKDKKPKLSIRDIFEKREKVLENQDIFQLDKMEEKRSIFDRRKTVDDDDQGLTMPKRQYDELFPDLKKGLTQEEVAKRQSQGYENKVKEENSRSYWDIFKNNLFTFFNFMCFIVALALIYVGSWGDLMFLVIIVFNLIIGIVQEIRAKNKLDKLRLVTAPKALVLRDGNFSTISASKIVASDLVSLTSGRQIPSDGLILTGEVEVNEALLTGESVPVLKKSGDKIFQGSFVVSGECLMKVTTVGEDNYISRLSKAAKKYRKPKSELLTSLNAIIKTVGLLIVPLGAIMFYNNYVNSNFDMFSAITKTSGALIGMIPAGLFLLTSISLALGSMKIASNHALVQEAYSIEMLARVDMLCLDKTGTITDGTMTVVEHVDLTEETSTKEIVSSMMHALTDNNQTSVALKNHFNDKEVFLAKKTYPFSSDRKFSAVTFTNGDTFFLGAPEFILRTTTQSLIEKIDKFLLQGYRVLLLGKSSGFDGEKPQDVTPLSLIVIQDRIREDAPAILDYFKKQGVEIKIISGDNPITVSEVARRAGVENTSKHISLDGLSLKEIEVIAKDYTVFGRVSPEQKLQLIKIFKKLGHTVAMTGDGVNDILAMKEADCSIAMASGSEATRNVAHLVLMDSNFASMPTVVSEGRRVINNIQRTASLFLVKTIMSVLLSLLTIILKIPYPFSPKQLLLFEYFVTGMPAFFLALEPSKERIKGRFIYNVLSRALPGALVAVSYILIINFTRNFFGFSQQDIVTMSVLLTTFVGFTVLNDVCKPYNVMRAVLFTFMSLCALSAVLFLPHFFSLSMLSLQKGLVMFLLMALASYCLKLFKFIVRGLAVLIFVRKEAN